MSRFFAPKSKHEQLIDSVITQLKNMDEHHGDLTEEINRLWNDCANSKENAMMSPDQRVNQVYQTLLKFYEEGPLQKNEELKNIKNNFFEECKKNGLKIDELISANILNRYS